MSILSRLFGRQESKGGSDLEARLTKLEAEAARAAPGYVGTAFNRAGDVALRGGEEDRAVQYYGRAIDAFLEDGQREAARGVANKIIRVRPKAVRTLCTLTWLDLAARHTATAVLHLRDYVDAAADHGGSREIAAAQVYEMARICPESEIVGAVADALDVLGYVDLAGEVHGWVQAGGSPHALEDSFELADACLLAATRSNERGKRSLGRQGATAPSKESGDEASAQADAEEKTGSRPEAPAEAAEVVHEDPEASDDAAEVVREDAEASDDAAEVVREDAEASDSAAEAVREDAEASDDAAEVVREDAEASDAPAEAVREDADDPDDADGESADEDAVETASKEEDAEDDPSDESDDPPDGAADSDDSDDQAPKDAPADGSSGKRGKKRKKKRKKRKKR